MSDGELAMAKVWDDVRGRVAVTVWASVWADVGTARDSVASDVSDNVWGTVGDNVTGELYEE